MYSAGAEMPAGGLIGQKLGETWAKPHRGDDMAFGRVMVRGESCLHALVQLHQPRALLRIAQPLSLATAGQNAAFTVLVSAASEIPGCWVRSG